MKGWFDAFRTDGGPTLYNLSNRTPVTGDITHVLIYLTFGTIFVAFLIIFPGVRKERITTFFSVTLSLYIGLAILLLANGTDWHVAKARILSPYRAFSHDKLYADLGVHMGLNSVNVSLKAIPVVNQTTLGIDYNERFYWTGATEMKEEYRSALVKGLPYPILTVVEYLSLDAEGFCWGGAYRQAGYYSSILLWASFAVWLPMNILFCVVPRYGGYSMAVVGGILLLSNIVYTTNLPPSPLVVPFEGSVFLRFSYGWCFWMAMATGILCVIVGCAISVVDLLLPHKFSTILEVDYDTPYDRHIILQDNKPNNNRSIEIRGSLEDKLNTRGLDNHGFLDDTRQKPWRFRQTTIVDPVTGEHHTQGKATEEIKVDAQAAKMW